MLPAPVSVEELLAQSSWLRRLAATLVAGEAAAEDLVQETWLVALRNPPIRGGSPRPWLARIARNLAANFRRAEARRKQHEAAVLPAEAGSDPALLTGEVEAQRLLAEAVLRLDEPSRSTVVLRYLRGLDSREIGRLQGVPDGTVRWRLKRALEILRADLDERSGGDRRAWCTAFAVLFPRGFQAPASGGAGWAAGASLMSTGTKIGVALALVFGLITAWILVEHREPAELETETAARIPSVDGSTSSDRSGIPAVPGLGETRETLRSEVASPVEPEIRACCVVGRVLDPEGRGLPGARIVARAPRLDATSLLAEVDEAPPSPETTSGADGIYSLALAGERPFVLLASHPDHAPVACGPVFAGERRDLELTVGSALRVEVFSTGAEGRATPAGAVVDVRVESLDSTGALWAGSGTTDSKGVVAFSGLPAGRASVRARSGARRGLRSVEPDGSGALTCSIELLATGRIDGTVVERETERPIAGARVGNSRSGVEEVATDELGRFALEGIDLGEGLWVLGAHAAGFAARYELVKLPPGSEQRTVTFALERAIRASGRVVDEAGRGVPHARVCFLGDLAVEPFSGERDRIRAETDAAGRFTAELHPGVVYRVLARGAGRGLALSACGPFAAGSAPVEMDELVLASAASLAGRVARTPGPAGSGVVQLHWAGDGDDSASILASRFTHLETTRPDPAGRFAFEGLAPGRYRLELVEPGSREPVEAFVDLAAGEARRDFVIGAEGPALEGTVTNASGGRLEGCTVNLQALGSPERVLDSTRTDAQGRFRLHGPETGRFRVAVVDPRLVYESRVLEPVESGAGELAIELVEFRSALSIRGVLITEAGPVPERVFVGFRDTRTQERLGRVAIPEEDGTFAMKNLRDVPYDLELVDFDGRWEPVRIDGVIPGGPPVEMRLVPRR